jgi:hypothetical protein
MCKLFGRIWFKSHDGYSAPTFTLTDIFEELVNVFTKWRYHLFTSSALLVNDWIGPHVQSPMSSSGVQITEKFNEERRVSHHSRVSC